ncbi:hypothetical protein HHK36_025583 [Tetracentron sinense]|uniref:non-specific serine/threonine protein kinase n=1 Tax=Tetracentron sinense TaxID=13715 RepID=A0A834YHV5_TETSI|nr:hypothetical protein HHK36_025583 [Tetracentron sinense]
MYGNYDGKSQLPVFGLYLGVNFWEEVKFERFSDVVIKEIIHVATMDYIQVCLVKSGAGTPFISALELRPLTNSTYNVESGSLLLYMRLDLGSSTTNQIRYADDVYDRIWSPYEQSDWEPFSTSLKVEKVSDVSKYYMVPSTVMSTAVRPIKANNPLKLPLTPADPTSKFHYFMYFAEIEQLQNNQSREISIDLNGERVTTGIPGYLTTDVFYWSKPLVGSFIMVSLSKTTGSTLPPLLNAIEIYMGKDFVLSPTDRKDVDAIKEIKGIYGLKRHWNGDPCLPRNYSWDGLTCRFDDNNPPIIISLNLSSSGLTGNIADSLANLLSIESLDLSNNSFEGPVPEFLAKLPNLQILNLIDNKLTGPLPTNLIERSQNGLQLRVDPYLCMKDTCKKSKKNIIPVVLSITSTLVLLIALVFLWSLIKRRQEGSTLDESLSWNLASFVGNCNEGGNMALIYEYLANGNLQDYLTGEDVLSWEERLRIAVDAAQGLEYLHTGCKPPIVHRDVKTANILLDAKFQGKIADFGL